LNEVRWLSEIISYSAWSKADGIAAYFEVLATQQNAKLTDNTAQRINQRWLKRKNGALSAASSDPMSGVWLGG